MAARVFFGSGEETEGGNEERERYEGNEKKMRGRERFSADYIGYFGLFQPLPSIN